MRLGRIGGSGQTGASWSWDAQVESGHLSFGLLLRAEGGDRKCLWAPGDRTQVHSGHLV